MTLSEQFDDRSISPEPAEKTKIQDCQKLFQNRYFSSENSNFGRTILPTDRLRTSEMLIFTGVTHVCRGK